MFRHVSVDGNQPRIYHVEETVYVLFTYYTPSTFHVNTLGVTRRTIKILFVFATYVSYSLLCKLVFFG